MSELNSSTGGSEQVAILGAGSWGSALAHLLAGNGHAVTIWDRNVEIVDQIETYHTNAVYLPNVSLPESLRAVNSMREAVTPKTDWVIVAVSSTGIRDIASELGDLLTPTCAIISATKGLEADTALTMSEVFGLLLNDIAYGGIVSLSGPNLSQEVVRRVPTVSVVASENIVLARRARTLLTVPHAFRIYTHTDVKGVELGGALKNVLAIGAGISDGLGFGDNTKAALMTRGLMEMTQIGLACGAKPLTFLGLAGVGDLMATAGSTLSRNYRVGFAIAHRKPLQTILRELGQVAEGVTTTKAAKVLAKRFHVETPLFDMLYEVIYNGKSPGVAVEELMSRPAKDEYM